MARRRAGADPKEAALRQGRCLNPHPEHVRDPAFLASEFFDARDVVQVKYEMVRRVTAEGASVTAAAAEFGYSRPSFYEAAAALAGSGLQGLLPARPGPSAGWPPTPRCGPQTWWPRSKRPSACACTPARSSARWPATGSATPKAADQLAWETAP